jgi:putative transposase
MLFPPMPSTYALTFVSYQRKAIFARTANAELLLQTFFHYRAQSRYQLHGFVIMPEHVHLLITPQSQQTIERCIQCIKGGYSHAMHKQFAGEIWQPGYHEHRVRDASDFCNQITYIAENPNRRHLQNHPYIHTKFLDQIDFISPHCKQAGTGRCGPITKTRVSMPMPGPKLLFRWALIVYPTGLPAMSVSTTMILSRTCSPYCLTSAVFCFLVLSVSQ